MLNWIFYPKSKRPPQIALRVVSIFKEMADKIDNRSFDFKSNQVLGIVSTRLQEIGFRIEKSSMKERLRSYVKTHHIAAHNTRLANMRHFAKPEEVVWKA